MYKLSVTLSVLILAAGIAVAQRTDLGVYPEPPAPPLPAAGGTFVDPTFGTTIMRLSDASDTPGTVPPGSNFGCRNSYSYWPTFNLDSTLAIFTCDYQQPNQTWNTSSTVLVHFDPVNFRIVSKNPIDLQMEAEDAIWSDVTPTVIYGHSGSQLRAFDVVTNQSTVVHDFASDFPGKVLRQITKSKGDDEFAFSLMDQNGGPNIAFAVWSRSQNRVLMTRQMGHDEVHIDKSGRYLAAMNVQGVQDAESQVYDVGSGAVQNLTNCSPDFAFDHSDFGQGIVAGVEDCTPSITVRNLATPHQFTTILKPFLFPDGTADWS
ncbi:MAG: hypothetical protein M1541_10360, partial [Acidobacteria bacterium]|nr:hypothetical protein [Acidobacteriota bacterium]